MPAARGDGGRTGVAAPVDLGWRPAIVLMLVALVDRIETGIVPGVLSLIQEEWGFSDTAAGAIPTAVTLAGLFVTLPAGYLADRANRKNLIAVMVFSWSFITMGSALAPSFAIFFLTRIALGVADNVDTPSALSLMGDFFEPRRRSRAYGYQRMCYLIGGAIGTLLGGIIAQLYGWRMAFFSMVIPGMLVAWLVFRLPEPVRGAMDHLAKAGGKTSDEEPAAPAVPTAAIAGKGLKGLWADCKNLMKVKTIFYVYFGLTCLFMGISGIFYWLPTFYRRTFELGAGLSGSLTALASIIGVVGGTFIGGALGDAWHGNRKGARIVISGWALLIGSLMLGAAFAIGSLPFQYVTFIASIVVMAMASPNLTAAIADVIPANRRGIGFALVTFLMSVGSAFGPLGVGAASDATGSLNLAFYVLVVPMIIGSIVVLMGRNTYDEDARHIAQQ